jgi:hypothetical protein
VVFDCREIAHNVGHCVYNELIQLLCTVNLVHGVSLMTGAIRISLDRAPDAVTEVFAMTSGMKMLLSIDVEIFLVVQVQKVELVFILTGTTISNVVSHCDWHSNSLLDACKQQFLE